MREAIILAGGLGTRLREAVPDLPKCMAPVNGKPFISYLVNRLLQQGVTRFVLALGYKSAIIEDYICKNYPDANFIFSVEQEPLGTGGAILLAIQKALSPQVLILNGDTLFDIDTENLFSFHKDKQADCSLALKRMYHFSRYGTVVINEEEKVAEFLEKKYCDTGLINGGVYVVNRDKILKECFPQVWSFEKDYLETFIHKHHIFGMEQNKYFIDIGIPEDFKRAQTELIHL